MARTKRNAALAVTVQPRWRAALYTRLSREDGDKPESDSIANQRALLERFADQQPDLQVVGHYSDGPVKIGLNQKHPYSKGSTDLVLFLFCKYKRR